MAENARGNLVPMIGSISHKRFSVLYWNNDVIRWSRYGAQNSSRVTLGHIEVLPKALSQVERNHRGIFPSKGPISGS